MAKRKHTPEEIINKLREAEVVIAAGNTVAEARRSIGVSEQAFYRWRSEYGSLRIDQARRLKQLSVSNCRLRRAVAELTLDNDTGFGSCLPPPIRANFSPTLASLLNQLVPELTVEQLKFEVVQKIKARAATEAAGKDVEEVLGSTTRCSATT